MLSFLLLILTTQYLSQTPVKGPVSALTPAQQKAMAEIDSLNNQIIKFFTQKDLNAALQKGIEMQAVIDNNGLGENFNALIALTNLAEIYLAKSRESDAIKLFLRVLDGFQKRPDASGAAIAKVTERLGLAYYDKAEYEKAEQCYRNAIELRAKANGAESREIAAAYKDLGNVYRMENKFEQADTAYLKAIEISDKALTKEEKWERKDLEYYQCFLYHWGFRINKLQDMARKWDVFSKARGPSQADRAARVSSGGVVNGKAIRLVKPPYPANGATGFVIVMVTIDEKGDVISAKATCGINNFLRVSEEAASKSEFSPTLLDGKPVKVSGIIIYHFGNM